jgi:hypothetical protein
VSRCVEIAFTFWIRSSQHQFQFQPNNHPSHAGLGNWAYAPVSASSKLCTDLGFTSTMTWLGRHCNCIGEPQTPLLRLPELRKTITGLTQLWGKIWHIQQHDNV